MSIQRTAKVSHPRNAIENAKDYGSPRQNERPGAIFHAEPLIIATSTTAP